MPTIPLKKAYLCLNCESVFDLANRISVMTCPNCGSSNMWPLGMWTLSPAEKLRLQPWRKGELDATDQQRQKGDHPCCEITVGAV
jgi:predicted  nucleic acid-binding Zn-ribbon protein